MIKIDVPNIDDIAKEYCDRLMCSVRKNTLNDLNVEGKEELINKVEGLYRAKPNELKRKHCCFRLYLRTKFPNIEEQDNIKKCFFDYTKAMKWKTYNEELSYWLAKNYK